MLIMHTNVACICVLQYSCNVFALAPNWIYYVLCIFFPWMLRSASNIYISFHSMQQMSKFMLHYIYVLQNRIMSMSKENYIWYFKHFAKWFNILSQRNRALILSSLPVMLTMGSLTSMCRCHGCTMLVRNCTRVDMESFLISSQFHFNAICLLNFISFQTF